IRHYGLLAGVNVSTKLEQCRRLLGLSATPRQARPHQTWIEWLVAWTGQEPLRCPRCQSPLTRYAVPPLLQPAAGVAAAMFPEAERQRLAPVDSSQWLVAGPVAVSSDAVSHRDVVGVDGAHGREKSAAKGCPVVWNDRWASRVVLAGTAWSGTGRCSCSRLA